MTYTNQHGEQSEISQADQQWLDDAYFTTLQCRLPADAKRAALAYRVSTKGQVDHDDIPMQKIACRKFAQQQGWRVVQEKAEKGVSGLQGLCQQTRCDPGTAHGGQQQRI